MTTTNDARTTATTGRGSGGGRAAATRIAALGRAELTLLLRNKTMLFTALLLPALVTFGMRGVVGQMGDGLGDVGLTVGTVLVPASVGFVLLFAVYSNLVGTYVVRREELVLKRLRTGSATDTEILVAAALPSVVISVVQCAVLLACGALVLDLEAPRRPDLLLLGLLLGTVTMAALAAFSAAFTSSAEAAQLTPMPLMLVSFAGSGLMIPLELFPDRIADICRLLPLTGPMELVRGGWTGSLGGADMLKALAVSVGWTALSVYAVRRWFRWDPRR
ncbi:ABC transporter permease [Streptomyces alkaliterrae]|uniref:Transport permease protein n=1 Tax=Streptomyces alkaliterrae TaxID=2213162 RepID=A0A5P0YSL6_9ACTN|nr:ABC transporter permease [Streptomyces alkaliterrae]MBB1254529.1 ABC transporter permease [Streptomyces alkaliterrae]MBB1260879.1 ABC transporter permease [Streptomyces alkaliterrae]MQS03314.1 ABC transporter permease [Streptomyces alkaliterrae]